MKTRLLQLNFAFFLVALTAGNASAQCSDTSTLATRIRHVLRTGGNNVDSGAGSQVTGNYWYLWSEYASWTENLGSNLIHQGQVYDDGNGLAYSQWNDAPSQLGPGTFSLTVYHVFDSSCGDHAEYDETVSLAVNKPTVGGTPITSQTPYALYNLGPGTDDIVPTSNGYQYNQSVVLTINTNCGGSDTCSDTPQWTINSPGGTLNLSSSSGTQTTLRVGPNPGNCSYDTPVSVSIGGFSSDPLTFAVDSPTYVVHRADLDLTENLNPGYRSNVSWQVADECLPANHFTTMPLYETFGTWSFPGVVSGWGPAQAESAPGFNYPFDSTVFRDYIYASSAPIDNPYPMWSSSGPPYSYSTVIEQAAHAYYVGTDAFTGGTNVFLGQIYYYQDHGDTF